MIYIALIILIATLTIGVPVPVSFMASCAWLIFFGGPDGAGYQATQLLSLIHILFRLDLRGGAHHTAVLRVGVERGRVAGCTGHSLFA